MGTTLTGLTPATTYDALIKVGDNGPITSALKVLSDGLGTNLPMEASTTGVNFTGVAQVGGVGIANTTQLAAKQDTLVSGTNIKTINSTSILGSGNIAVVTAPSGVSGAIQFSNGSAFASDAANFFWDDTNNRLGVGTNDPQTAGHFRTSGSTRGVLSVVNANDTTNYGSRVQLYNKQSGDPVVDGANGFALIYTDSTKSSFVYNYSDGPMIFGTAATERMRLNNNGGLVIKGSGSTSATTSLLVQNSAGTQAFKVADNLDITVGKDILMAVGNTIYMGNDRITSYNGNSFGFQLSGAWRARITTTGSVFGSDTINASAVLEAVSTTQGFLPPRMTTTQKNAIASPAAGLVVYDNTTNKLQCYNGSTWNDLF
jgi:hypothetical protein